MSLHSTLPWTQSPLVINGPMGGVASAPLAIAVSKAGGLGQIGVLAPNMEHLSAQLSEVEQALGRTDRGLLPIGVGFLVFRSKINETMHVISKFKPAVFWLFAAVELEDYAAWAEALRKASPQTQLWIQVGSVEAALKIAMNAKPDVLSIQGSDAGGHGFEKGASIISLVPEIKDGLRSAGLDTVRVVAAGGIADGRAGAAALTLGAEGVVLGTRFLTATEAKVHAQYRAAIIRATDGGQNTVRAKVFDEVKGPNEWPVTYDGRSIRNESFRDHSSGVGIDEIRRRHATSEEAGELFDEYGNGRGTIWCGTGVGLVRREQSAAEIVQEMRTGIGEALDTVKARF